ncbi:MAG: LptF/LptG family permease [Spirochaetia bacterium]|nr:LptF/LptG family permease [Spirochaetia bacterium]
MKLLDRHIVSSILRILILSVLLCTLMLMSVDLFSKLDSYVSHDVGKLQIVWATLLYAPQAFMLVLPPAILFTLTFFLSQLYANNEMIALMGSGFSLPRILAPILILSMVISVSTFFFNEFVVLPTTVDHQQYVDGLFKTTQNFDNRNITLMDESQGYILYARRYVERDRSLRDTTLVFKDSQGKISRRVDADRAIFSDGVWEFKNALVSTPEAGKLPRVRMDSFSDNRVTLAPNLFRNNSTDIATMGINLAIRYLGQLHRVDIESWWEQATTFYDRLSTPLTVLVMAWIACLIDYRNRRNVFLFSIFSSILIAIVYYVGKMLLQILSRQGVISPGWGVMIPYFVVCFLPLLFKFDRNKT